MKFLKTSALLGLLTVCNFSLSAQGPLLPVNEPDYNKPKVFSDLPEKLNLRLTTMQSLLNLSTGASVNVQIANSFPLVGIVVSKSDPADAFVKSVVITSSTRKGAVLTFTRITQEDGSFRYIGRMITKVAGDALEIVQEGNDYIIRKKGFYDMINE